ncbi:MAG: hypothetical protein Q9174_001477 [Haloplaca sp. 1 TL-2023]
MRLWGSLGPSLYASTLAFSSLVTALPASSTAGGGLFQTSPRIGQLNSFHQDLGVENFKFEWRFDNTVDLDVWSTLLDGLEGLRTIALRDTNARTKGDHFHLGSMRGVSIDISPSGADTVSNDMAAVCLYHILEKMVFLNIFEKAEVLCYEGNVIKATIVIDAFQRFPAATEADTSQLGSINTTNTITADDTTLKAVMPEFFFLTPPRDTPIPARVAIVTLMYTLTKMAVQDKTAIVPRCYFDPGPTWDASIIFPAEGPTRTQPPYMEYRWAIQTIGKVIDFFLHQRRFASMGGVVVVDGVELDTFLFQEGKPWNAEAPGNSTVATS